MDTPLATFKRNAAGEVILEQASPGWNSALPHSRRAHLTFRRETNGVHIRVAIDESLEDGNIRHAYGELQLDHEGIEALVGAAGFPAPEDA